MADPIQRRPGSDSSLGAATRAAAARAVHRVRDRGQSLTPVLQQLNAPHTPADRGLIQEMSYGTLRILPRLEAIAARLLNRPLGKDDRDLDALILIGLYQLTAMKIPEHAAVATTVEASRILGKPGKSALINALLRRFLRERAAMLADLDQDPRSRWLFPEWLLQRLRQDWPQDWESIVDASNRHPPMALRVNRMRVDPSDYAARLAATGITSRPIPGCAGALLLDHPCPTRELPGFEEGLVSVQDSGAQLAAQFLDARPGQRVLDACAAPGGKTANILERAGNALELVALDSDPSRLETVRATLERLGLSAHLALGDAAAPAGEWTGQPFDRILLDVPCSATGVIRRHPDIKWLRRPGDIAGMRALQASILDAVWALLKPGGRLLYATCSLLGEENHEQIAAFLTRQPRAREIPLESSFAKMRTHGRQLLPTVGGSDGFYYALLEKTSV